MADVNPGPAITANPNSIAVLASVETQQYGGLLQGQNALRLLGSARGVNANAVADTLIPIVNCSNYSVYLVIMTNASISLTTATAGIYTAAAAGGTNIVAVAALSSMTGATVVFNRTIASTAAQLNNATPNLYLRVGTAQGAAATFDCFVYGFDLT